MPQSDSRATLAHRETQQAIELLGEIAWSRNALSQTETETASLTKATEAALFRDMIDALPANSEERRDYQSIAFQQYGLEMVVGVGDEPHDFATLARASRDNAIEAGGKIPDLAKAMESERVVFVQRCDDLLEIAPSVRVRLRAHRQMFTDAELKTVMHALDFVRVLRVNPWVLPSNEGWAGGAIQTLQQLSELLPESEVVVTTKTAVKPKVSSKDIAGRLLIRT